MTTTPNVSLTEIAVAPEQELVTLAADSEPVQAATRKGRPIETSPPPTPAEVLTLARGLPFTKSVLGPMVEGASAAQRRFLHTLFTQEQESREYAKRARLTRNAAFPVVKTFEGYDWSNLNWPPDWGRAQLAAFDFITQQENLVFYGDVGTGKTHLAIALGHAACQAGYRVRFTTAASLVSQLRQAQTAGRLDRELGAIGRNDLIIIDELGYLPIDGQGARLLFQVIADAYEKRSIVYTSNLEFSRWGSVFGDEQMAAAIIDRTVHHGRMLRFKGGSYRVANATMK